MTTTELRQDLLAMGFSPELAYAIAEDEADASTDWRPGEHYSADGREFNEEGLYHGEM